jgi:predicted phage terminase large subunit-like protein
MLVAEESARATKAAQAAAIAEARRDTEAVRARCKSLAGFIREAWQHIPELATVPYVHGWHIDLICAHLEAITRGRFISLGLENRFLANVPPGTMKSLLVSVFWPAWEWGPEGLAYLQYIVTSYREDYCSRDTRRMRDLCVSEWYQSLWGDKVVMDAVGDTRISNKAGGWREGVPFGSLTGARADRVIIDDPHSVDTAESEAQRNRTTLRFRESVPSRVNDPKKSAIVVIMQRLHVNDVSGIIEQLKLPYVHLMLPMEFEPDRRCVTPIGKDPRRQASELLFPQRFPREVVERDKASMTLPAVAGQYQQRPYLRGGAMFKRGWFDIVPAAPKGTRWVRHWDLAASKKKGSGIGQAWTAGVKLGLGPDGNYYVGHVIRVMDEGDEVRRAIYTTAKADTIEVEISLPQDPGQAGKVQAKDMVKMLDGWLVRAVPESGDKLTRAEPFQAQAAQGNVKIVQAPGADAAWIGPFLDEISAFPGSPTKDQVDACSGAYAALQRQRLASSRYGDIGGVAHSVGKEEVLAPGLM